MNRIQKFKAGGSIEQKQKAKGEQGVCWELQAVCGVCRGLVGRVRL